MAKYRRSDGRTFTTPDGRRCEHDPHVYVDDYFEGTVNRNHARPVHRPKSFLRSLNNSRQTIDQGAFIDDMIISDTNKGRRNGAEQMIYDEMAAATRSGAVAQGVDKTKTINRSAPRTKSSVTYNSSTSARSPINPAARKSPAVKRAQSYQEGDRHFQSPPRPKQYSRSPPALAPPSPEHEHYAPPPPRAVPPEQQRTPASPHPAPFPARTELNSPKALRRTSFHGPQKIPPYQYRAPGPIASSSKPTARKAPIVVHVNAQGEPM